MFSLFEVTLISWGMFIIGWRWARMWDSIWSMVWTLLGPNRPIRVVPNETKVFDMSVGASIEPEHIPAMWKTYMRAYIFHGEMCRRTLSVREMKDRIGLDWRGQSKYKAVLVQGGVIHVEPSGGVRWLMSWAERRKVLPLLPYPRNVEPPPFGPRKV